jgi:hypothetical protein
VPEAKDNVLAHSVRDKARSLDLIAERIVDTLGVLMQTRRRAPTEDKPLCPL